MIEKEKEMKKAVKEIIEAKRNINKAIYKIIEIAEWWYVDDEIKADLKANLEYINYSIENIFYKINMEYDDVVRIANVENLNEIQEVGIKSLINKKFISNVKRAEIEKYKENTIFKIEMLFSRDEMLDYFS